MPDGRDDFAISHVAALASLSLTPDEERLYARQVTEILAYARRILDVPMERPVEDAPQPPETGRLREDVVQPSLGSAETLGQSIDRQGANGLFRVPRVIG